MPSGVTGKFPECNEENYVHVINFAEVNALFYIIKAIVVHSKKENGTTEFEKK